MSQVAPAAKAAKTQEAVEAMEPAKALATPTQVLAGVLQRMGDVLGPGATYSLVHYGAHEEGLALAAQDRPASPEDAVATVARILGLAATLARPEGRLVVHVKPAPNVSLSSRGTAALVVGLLEGMLTAATGGAVQARGEPAADAAGELDIEMG
jgi:hypothetical protein